MAKKYCVIDESKLGDSPSQFDFVNDSKNNKLL